MQRAAKRVRLSDWPCVRSQPLHVSCIPRAAQPKSVNPSSNPPYLPRPLGVQAPLRSQASLESPGRSRFLDAEGRKEERRIITKELSKSYFQDLSTLSQTGGKLWIAPETNIKAERALYFPAIQGQSLADKQPKNTADILLDKVSLVAVLNTKISVEHVNSFLSSLPQDLAEDPHLQIVHVNLQENPMKSWLVGLFLSSLRKQVPVSQHSNYILTHQNIELLKEPLGMLNKHVGYLYLVDWLGRVRWAGVGFADPGGRELAGLQACIHVLLGRFKEDVAEQVTGDVHKVTM